MRFSFRLDIAPSGLAALAADHAERVPSAWEARAARLWSPAPRIDLVDRGFIVGALFRREIPATRVTDLDPAERRRILDTDGAALLANYWGGYIALLIAEDGSLSVLRDPSGMMPCYMQRMEGGAMLASDMTALATPGAAAVDFAALARMFAGIDVIGRRTGIAGVEELFPGERLTVTPSAIRIEQAWSPWDHVRPLAGLDFASAAQTLRATLKDSIGAWSTCFDKILVGVSGGLDSSIVAAALGPRTPGLRCLTMVEPGTDGDEQRYAEALVGKLGVRLDAPIYDLGAVDVTQPVLPNLPLPFALHFFHAIEAEHRRLGDPVDAYFSGNGGDDIFCALRSAVPLADRLLARGLRPGLIRTARDLADLTGSGMAAVAGKAWERVRRRKAGHRVRRDLSGLGAIGRAAAMDDGDRHPWLSAPPRALPGKAAHVAMLARAQKSIELYPRSNAPPQIVPLLSQPIVELCLSIPTWYWVRGGRDRAVARAAFDGLLPELILERRTKGSPSGFIRRVFDAQGEAAIATLRVGRLVEAGLLDPDWLDRAGEGLWQDDGRDHRILTFAAAEAWVRWWEEGPYPSGSFPLASQRGAAAPILSQSG
ncbi:asparagine synthase C-terminal domain-containing protein [Sphingopyxis sp.]|jgi:asparagine synthase (glutamine-hydrolysing)|uniref:asparagine synthase C-terminal domain-containing protein n=1 Tax=Sphingopyxis sp. TaxID=1908224 RepID=UPI002E02B508|nr:asparagine synthase C-terminal domain-containing protein [Sphingopyxis sp.]